VVGRKGEYYQLLYDLLGKGYTQVKVDGEIKKLREQIILDKNKKHDIDVLVDEIYLSELSQDSQKNTKETKNKQSKIENSVENKQENKSDKKVESVSSDGRERLSEAVEK